MIKVTIFLLTIGAALCSPVTPVKKCKGTTEKLFKSVIIYTPEGVCTSLPCKIKAGDTVKTNITFLVHQEVDEITLKCNVTALGETIEYPITNATKGCDMLTNTHCPIESDTEVTLFFAVKIPKITPRIKASLTFYMLDQVDEMISCFRLFAKVVGEKLHLIESSEY